MDLPGHRNTLWCCWGQCSVSVRVLTIWVLLDIVPTKIRDVYARNPRYGSLSVHAE